MGSSGECHCRDNNLLYDCNLPTKFVDDKSALEIIQRNFVSALNKSVANIINFVMEQNIKLNTTRCKKILKPGSHT